LNKNFKSPFSKGPSIFINLLVSLLTLVTFICIAEVTLQKLQTPTNLVIDKNWFKKNVSLNSRGYRDFEYSSERPEKTFRILVLGDSMTFGHGIDKSSNTYPKILETHLNNKTSKQKFEVINLAYPGYNTDSQLYDLYIKGFNFQPDMVFLGYYHNDIPRPGYLQCNPTNQDLIEGAGEIKTLIRRSALYHFVNLRYNRLLEKLNYKPKMEDCINEAYSSIGWEMETVYLDAIRKACLLRNVKLMIGVIPLMFKLNDNYPIKKMHSKLKSYCTKNRVECIDFFEEGFMGKNALELVVSPEDRHLNSQGAKIIAKSLFNKIKPLTTFNNLSDIHRVFPLQDLLTANELAHKVDEAYGEAKEKRQNPKIFFPVSDKKNNIKIDFQNSNGKNVFIQTQSNAAQQAETKSKFTLDNRGRFIKHAFSTFSPQIHKEISIDKVEKNNKEILFTHILYQPGGKKLSRKISFELSGIETPGKGKLIYIEKGIPFQDPKTVIQKLFSIPNNTQDYQLETDIYNQLLFFHHYKWGELMDTIIKDIIKINPSPIILRAIARTYKTTKEENKLGQVKKKVPQLLKGFLN
jgi:hypothetical protein